LSLSKDIKDFALDLGYSKVAITMGNSFSTYLEELKARYDMHGEIYKQTTRKLQSEVTL